MRFAAVSNKARSIRLGSAALAALVGVYCAGCGSAAAQSDAKEGGIARGVRIMDAPPPPTSPSHDTAGAPPSVPTAPASLQPDDTASVPLLVPAAPAATPGPATPLLPPQQPSDNYVAPAASAPPPNNVAAVPSPSDFGMRLVPQNFAALSAAMQIPNTAGLAMQMLPGQEIAAGSPITFQLSTKKPGYLILLDVDAGGRLSQIYPNPMSLLEPTGPRAKSNLLRPGQVLQLPDRANPYAGFELVASPPSGTAMVIAMLSEHPVQLVDLPDVPGSLIGSVSTVDYLVNLSNQLRIPDAAGDGGLEDAHWSFDVKFYAIR
jgi:hypothetical protein